MIIALDFDDTYNKSPMLWDTLIENAQDQGHEIILATYRHETLDSDPLIDELIEWGIPCYFTDGKAKRPFLLGLGIKVDVWIDDNPFSITQDSAWTHDSPELHAWREANLLKTARLDVA
jgi:hypothetical protein